MLWVQVTSSRNRLSVPRQVIHSTADIPCQKALEDVFFDRFFQWAPAQNCLARVGVKGGVACTLRSSELTGERKHRVPPANLSDTCGYTPNRVQSVHTSKEQENYTGSSGLEVERKADVRLTQRKGFIFVFLSPATYRAAAPSSLGRLLHLNCWSQRDRWFHSLPGMRDNASGVPRAWTHATSGLVSVSCWPDHPQDPTSRGPAYFPGKSLPLPERLPNWSF